MQKHSITLFAVLALAFASSVWVDQNQEALRESAAEEREIGMIESALRNGAGSGINLTCKSWSCEWNTSEPMACYCDGEFVPSKLAEPADPLSQRYTMTRSITRTLPFTSIQSPGRKSR